MTEDERLIDLLRAALPPVSGDLPRRDLWPEVLNRPRHRPSAWPDLVLAAAVVLAFILFPRSLLVIAYHL